MDLRVLIDEIQLRLLKADELAFKEIYSRYRQPVFEAAYRRLAGNETAVDKKYMLYLPDTVTVMVPASKSPASFHELSREQARTNAAGHMPNQQVLFNRRLAGIKKFMDRQPKIVNTSNSKINTHSFFPNTPVTDVLISIQKPMAFPLFLMRKE